MEYHDRTLEYDDVTLDGNTFTGCTLRDCRVIFRGGAFAAFACTFDNVRWILEGPAAGALSLLALIYREGGEQGQRLVEECFESIRQGTTDQEREL